MSVLCPEHRQKKFIYLLDDMGDSGGVMRYLVELARLRDDFTEEEKASAGQLDECSICVRYLFSRDREGRVGIRINSDSMIVRGVLSIFAEIYRGSREQEIRACPPVYQNYLPQGLVPSFERKDGVKRLYYKLVDFSRSWK